MCYTISMTTADTKRIEKIARESAALARKTRKMLKKTNELGRPAAMPGPCPSFKVRGRPALVTLRLSV